VTDVQARVAWVLAGLTLVLSVADVVVTAQYRPLLSEASVAEHGFPFVEGAVLGSAVLGAAIITRYERHAVGWLLSLVGSTGAFSLLTESYSIWVVSDGGPGSRSLAGVSGWLSALLGGQLAIGGLALMFLLAPDGRLLSRRWRVAAAAPAAGVLVCIVALLTADPTTFDLQTMDSGPVRGPLFNLGFSLITLGLVAAVASLVVRLRRSRGEVRRQVVLIVLSVVLVVTGIACVGVVESLNGGRQTWAASLPLLVAYLMLPILFGIAVLRYRLYDIEVIVNRTVVVTVGTAFAAIGYTTLVVTAGSAVHSRTGDFWLSLLGTALVALAFQPLRRQVVRFANRLAYGARAQPYEALSDFSGRLAETPSAETLLPVVADAAGRAVSARRAVASLEVPGATTLAARWGVGEVDDGSDRHVVEVRTAGGRLGAITVWLPKGRPLRPADERLLAALSDQAAVSFRNAAMEGQLAARVAELDHATRELSASRSRIIEADDAARQALEEAISRKVLPQLEALPDRIVGARQAVAHRTPAHGIDLLVAATNEALESLRELTRGVFPTQLARSGVEPALRSLLARCGSASAMHVDASASGRRFSPRVEAAVYFCCAEASRAGPIASLELSVVADSLVLEVVAVSAGQVDLRPVGDRVAAVDGTVTTEPGLLRVVIPVGDAARTAESPVARVPGL
jgi:hypothetical protein